MTVLWNHLTNKYPNDWPNYNHTSPTRLPITNHLVNLHFNLQSKHHFIMNLVNSQLVTKNCHFSQSWAITPPPHPFFSCTYSSTPTTVYSISHHQPITTDIIHYYNPWVWQCQFLGHYECIRPSPPKWDIVYGQWSLMTTVPNGYINNITTTIPLFTPSTPSFSNIISTSSIFLYPPHPNNKHQLHTFPHFFSFHNVLFSSLCCCPLFLPFSHNDNIPSFPHFPSFTSFEWAISSSLCGYPRHCNNFDHFSLISVRHNGQRIKIHYKTTFHLTFLCSID